MVIDLTEILQSIGIFTIGTTILVFAMKSIINQYLNKDIEKYKNELIQNQIRFSKLHEERAHVIRDLYEKLVDMELAMLSFTSPLQSVGDTSPKEKAKKASNLINDFMIFNNKNRIYFDKKTCELLDSIHKTLKTAYIKFTVFKIQEEESELAGTQKQMDVWLECWDSVSKTVPELKGRLETEFRSILGVSTD